jgi:hypothetical protein
MSQFKEHLKHVHNVHVTTNFELWYTNSKTRLL